MIVLKNVQILALESSVLFSKNTRTVPHIIGRAYVGVVEASIRPRYQGQVAVSANHSPLYVPQIGVIKYKHVDWTLTSPDLYVLWSRI